MVINTMETRFNQTPARIISFISIRPVPKTIALGAVAKGSINAQEEAIQAAAIIPKGCTFNTGARAASTGNIRVQVAIF